MICYDRLALVLAWTAIELIVSLQASAIYQPVLQVITTSLCVSQSLCVDDKCKWKSYSCFDIICLQAAVISLSRLSCKLVPLGASNQKDNV